MDFVEIGGRRWAVGLDWLALMDRPNPLRSEVRQHAKELNANSYAIRKESLQQIGFGRFEGPKVPKAWALAANVADAETEPWLGMFRLGARGDGELWWYIAVRDGQAILPDGDVVGDLDRVQAARERHEGLGGWTFKTGGIAELETLLAKAPRLEARLYDTEVRVDWPKVRWTFGAAALCAASLLGWHWYRQHVDLQRQMEEARRRALLAAIRRRPEQAAMPPSQAAPKIVFPWEKEPAPARLLGACASLLDKTPVSVGGWSLSAWSCGPQAWSAVFKRSGGAGTLVGPIGELSLDGESIHQHGEMNGLPGDPDGLTSPSIALRQLFGIAQRWGFKVEAREKIEASPPPALPGQQQPPPSPPPWRMFEVRVSGISLPPDDVGDLFAGVRGLRLEKIEGRVSHVGLSEIGEGDSLARITNNSGFDWAVEGKLYVQR